MFLEKRGVDLVAEELIINPLECREGMRQQ
jgi:hypothetical protein